MPLVSCPDCKAKVSSDASSCPKCGRPRIRNGVRETWKEDGVTLGSVVGGLIVLAVLFAGVRACSSWLDSIPHLSERKNTIVSGVVNIPPAQDVYYKLDIKANFSNAVANGTFSAAGGSGNDIVALVGDEQNVINWKNNHKAQVLWQTDGEQTVGSFNVPLKSGTAYYLVLSNTSSESAKQVTINATLTFKESDAKATDP